MMRNSIPCLGIIRIRCKGFDLSLSFIPFGKGTPIGIGGKNSNYFNMSSEKDSLREWSTYYSYKAADKTGS